MTDEPQKPQMHFAQDDETEKLKQWWKRNGTGIVAGIVLGVGGVSGIQGWRMYQDYQTGQASMYYQQMLVAVAKEDNEAAVRAADTLVVSHSESGYADIARLMLARLAVDAGDHGQAETVLEDLLAVTKDPAMGHTARIRLAVLALQAGKADRIKALAAEGQEGGFASQYQELLGDALTEVGEWEQAQQAYQSALAAMASDSPAGQLLNAKLNMTRQGADTL
ncbi:MAG: tetratricopeptide repeat protein [Arenicellales bacterium]